MANIQERRDKAGRLILLFHPRSSRAGAGWEAVEAVDSYVRRFHRLGRKRAQEKRPRHLPRPLRRNAERA